MDRDLRDAERSGDVVRHAFQLRRAGRLEECLDILEAGWLGGNSECGDALFPILDELRTRQRVLVSARLDRLACLGMRRAQRAWEDWFPQLTEIVGVSDNTRALRRVVIEQSERPESILILRGASGTGKRHAAHVLHALTGGTKFSVLFHEFPQRDGELPPEHGTLYFEVERPAVGDWEARCVDSCKERNTRLVVGLNVADDDDAPMPSWHTLNSLEHTDYFIAPLANRREDLPELIEKGFPRHLLAHPEPEFAEIKVVRIAPKALEELVARPWRNVRVLFHALRMAAHRAHATSESETLTIGPDHLSR